MIKSSVLNVPGSSIFCNSRIKSYPDGSQTVLVCDRNIFGGSGWEAVKPNVVSVQRNDHSDANAPDRSMRRARAQVKDLAMCTDFKYFVTLTLDADKVDRYDMAAITRKLNAWCDNQVRRKGLAYVLVPERHKDGAIHFHGFFNGALEALDSGTISLPGGGKPRKPRSQTQRNQWLEQGGHVVYNLPGWSLGFTTAIELYGEYSRAVGYVCKYIGKEGEKVGGRWYYSGGKLGHPDVSYCDLDLYDLASMPGAYSFAVKAAGLSFVQVTLIGGNDHEKMFQDSSLCPGGYALPSGGVLRPNQAYGLRPMQGCSPG